jgi:hypothetical protein
VEEIADREEGEVSKREKGEILMVGGFDVTCTHVRTCSEFGGCNEMGFHFNRRTHICFK